jgi:hypothetical protein
MINDAHDKFIESLGPGLSEWVEPLPPITFRPAAEFEKRLGPEIGAGSSREVFSVKDNPKAVIKRCKLPFIGANMYEFFIWNSVRSGKWKDVFGEIVEISEDGRYLMMECLEDVKPEEHHLTPTAPDWGQDLQPKNFGKSADGVFKLRDYAMGNLSSVLNSARPHRYAWQKAEPKNKGSEEA